MQPATLDKLIWILLYGGLLAVALGLSVQRNDAALGWGIVTGGGIGAVIGIALIAVRSRMKGGGQ